MRRTGQAQTGADFFMRRIALVYGVIKRALPFVCLFLSAVRGEAQIQVDLKFKRLQYIAYEPVVATLGITNLAGRDVDLHDADGQSWFGFEVTGSESQPIPPIPRKRSAAIANQGWAEGHATDQSHSALSGAGLRCLSCSCAYLFRRSREIFFTREQRFFEVTDARPI
jgi:hypothetical protein